MDKQDIPKPLPGFGAINRYWDRRHNAITAKILPGEYYVSTQREIIATVLGSCVSACVRDARHGIGAMNHFLLPLHKGEHWSEKIAEDSQATRYGNYAMEHMINDVLKYGGRKQDLEFKVFGGSRVIGEMGTIGNNNIRFVLNYLKIEGYRLLAQDVGGRNPRKVLFDPQSGKVRVKKIQSLHNETIIKREEEFMQSLEKPEAITGEIELF